jgi:hypothetical protein
MPEQGDKGHDWFRTVVSILIATVTVVGAITAWRISVASNAASSFDSKGLSAALAGANAGITISTYLSMNMGFFADYREHLEKAKLLEMDASKEPDPERHAAMREEAVRERSLAATARGYLDSDYLSFDPETGEEVFDGNRFWTANWAEASTVQDLEEQPFFAQADRLRDKAWGLVIVTVALGAALFLFTAAITVRGRGKYVLAVCALPVFLGAVALAAVLELVTRGAV